MKLFSWIGLSKRGKESFPWTWGGCAHRQTDRQTCMQAKGIISFLKITPNQFFMET